MLFKNIQQSSRQILNCINKIPYKFYAQIAYFLLIHNYYMLLKWLDKSIIKPFGEYIHKYIKHEPTESQWIQIYSLLTSECTTEMGVDDMFFTSESQYVISYTSCFDTFLKDEFAYFQSSSIKTPSYDPEVQQIPQQYETLFIARYDDAFIFKSFPAFVKMNKTELNTKPNNSNIEFLYVQYCHPSMYRSIELTIPTGYYLEGNDLFTPAFVQRILELQNTYYIYDMDYEIRIVDHNVETKTIKSDEYITFKKDGYEIKKFGLSEKDHKDEQENKEEQDVNSDSEIDSEIDSDYSSNNEQGKSLIDFFRSFNFFT